MKTEKSVILKFIEMYGWAILAAVLIVGNIWYFGFFNPNQERDMIYFNINHTKNCSNYTVLYECHWICSQLNDTLPVC